jgi:biotin carboxylase
MKKRVMILGAGPNQLPLIKKARDEGHFVITVDYLPENIGHRFSHHYVNCSTTDKEGVASAAQQLSIDAIVTTASDVAVPTLSYVAWLLGLPGPSLQTAHFMSNKVQFRSFQQKNRLECPKFIHSDTFDDAWEKLQTLSMPLMFKPSDSSGSRGINRVEERDYSLCKKAFWNSHMYTRSGIVCIEEHIDGIEVGGDGFMSNGELVFCSITQKFVRWFVPVGHRLPTNIAMEDQIRLREQIATACKLVDYNNGPVNFDVMVSRGHITIIEMGARSGGNGIASLVKHATGFDVHLATLRNSLAMPIGKVPDCKKTIRGCGSMILGISQNGILETMSSAQELKAEIPQVFDCNFSVSCGDIIEPLIHSGNQIGTVTFSCKDESDYAQITACIEKKLSIRISTIKTNDEPLSNISSHDQDFSCNLKNALSVK